MKVKTGGKEENNHYRKKLSSGSGSQVHKIWLSCLEKEIEILWNQLCEAWVKSDEYWAAKGQSWGLSVRFCLGCPYTNQPPKYFQGSFLSMYVKLMVFGRDPLPSKITNKMAQKAQRPHTWVSIWKLYRGLKRKESMAAALNTIIIQAKSGNSSTDRWDDSL